MNVEQTNKQHRRQQESGRVRAGGWQQRRLCVCSTGYVISDCTLLMLLWLKWKRQTNHFGVEKKSLVDNQFVFSRLIFFAVSHIIKKVQILLAKSIAVSPL